MTTTVIYHGNCFDGFGAAWAAWKALGETAEYRAALYGDPPPTLINADQGKLYLLDFSFPRNILIALTKEFDLTVLDHHKTAQADLDGLAFAKFDLAKSGATLAWEHFHPDKPIPPMISYVQDRDLWKFDLPGSREISAWMRSWPFDFGWWSRAEVDLRLAFEECRKEGEAILRFQQQQVSNMADNFFWKEMRGNIVPVVNATVFFSEVGEELCKRHPNSPFSAYYLDRKDGKRQWGLRSRGGFDCSKVAKLYGGGGHPGAAGFEEDIP